MHLLARVFYPKRCVCKSLTCNKLRLFLFASQRLADVSCRVADAHEPRSDWFLWSSIGTCWASGLFLETQKQTKDTKAQREINAQDQDPTAQPNAPQSKI